MIVPVAHKSTFAAFRSSGVRARSGFIQMIFVKPGDNQEAIQLAFALNRKFGNAVRRNRARRRIREAFRQVCDPTTVPTGSAFLLNASPAVNQQSFDELLTSVRSCLLALEAKGALQ